MSADDRAPARPTIDDPDDADGALLVDEVDLSALPDELSIPAGWSGARLLVRLHGEAVGQLTLPAPRRDAAGATFALGPAIARAVVEGRLDGVLDALARRAVERGTSGVEDTWRAAPGGSGHDGPGPALTIATCTRDRPAAVERLLLSLAADAAAGADVLVVDNAPRDEATRAVVARHPWARYAVQPRPGLDHARNLALERARGDVVAFADDDVVVDAAWGATVRSLFARNPELTMLTGLVEPLSLETQAERWFELYGGFGRGYSPRWIHAPGASRRAIAFAHANTGRYGTGANLAVRRADALRLGGFDPALDVGTVTRGGGDLEMMFRVLKGEGVIGYSNAVVVRHAHRRRRDELVSQIESWGTGMSAHLARTARAHPDERRQIAALRAWLYGTWFAKRWATSYVRTPFPRSLIRRELAGSFRGAALYAEASRDRPPPASTPRIRGNAAGVGERHGPRAVYAVRCGEPWEPLDVPHGQTVALRVHGGERMLGEIAIEGIGGSVGVTRVRDLVAARWRRALLGGETNVARRRVSALVLGRRA